MKKKTSHNSLAVWKKINYITFTGRKTMLIFSAVLLSEIQLNDIPPILTKVIIKHCVIY